MHMLDPDRQTNCVAVSLKVTRIALSAAVAMGMSVMRSGNMFGGHCTSTHCCARTRCM